MYFLLHSVLQISLQFAKYQYDSIDKTVVKKYALLFFALKFHNNWKLMIQN